MGIQEALFKRLRESKNAAAEPAVEAALAHATPTEQAALAELLLQRDRRPGWIALIRCFDKLPEEVQQNLVERPRDLFGPLSDTMDDDQGNARANVICLVRKAADPSLVFLLTEALSDARPEVRNLAAEAILEAIRRFRARPEAPVNNATEAGAEDGATSVANAEAPEAYAQAEPSHLRRAVDFALRQYKTHRNGNIVLAALLFERQQDSPLWAIFADAYEEVTRTAVQLLRQVDDVALAPAALLALGSPLRAAAAAGILACNSPELFASVAREGFRLLDPVLRLGAVGIAYPRMLATIPEEAPWNSTTWFDYLRLVEGFGLPLELKMAWLMKLGETAPSPIAKLILLRSLAALNRPETTQWILRMTCDADECVARSAARHLIWRRPGEWKAHANVLMQSPHDSVRKLVSQAVSPGQFERLWHDYLKLPPAVQVLTARALSETDTQFTELLRTRLASQDAVDNAQGLKMLMTLQDLRPFRDLVIGLCVHADPRIASTAVRLVGRLEDPSLRDILEAAARHRDPRVRANAVEAMEQLQVADRSQQVLTLLNSRHNRERANAIRAISKYDFSTARECLLKMLSDGSPRHRLSALWVVGQLNLLELVRQVASLARRDTSRHVRKQAEEVLAQLGEAASAFSQSVPA